MIINGALNLIELEGKIGKNKKILKLFLLPPPFNPHELMNCGKIDSTDIDSYLIKQFDVINKKDPKKKINYLINKNIFMPQRKKKEGFSYSKQITDLFDDVDGIIETQSSKFEGVLVHNINSIIPCFYISENRIIQQLKSDILNIGKNPYQNYNIMNLRYVSDGIIQINNEVTYVLTKIIGGKNELRNFNETELKFIKDIKNSMTITSPINKTGEQNKQNKKSDSKISSDLYYWRKPYNPTNAVIELLLRKFVTDILDNHTDVSVKKIFEEIIKNDFRKRMNGIFNLTDGYLENLQRNISDIEKIWLDIDPEKREENNINEEKSLYKNILLKNDDGLYNYGGDLGKIDNFRDFLMGISKFYEQNIYDEYVYVLLSMKACQIICSGVSIFYLSCMSYREGLSLVRLLVKYFGFEIKKCSYLNGDIASAHERIRLSQINRDIFELFLPQIMTGCVDISMFEEYII